MSKLIVTKKEATTQEGSIRAKVIDTIRKGGARGVERDTVNKKFKDAAPGAIAYLKAQGFIKEVNSASSKS